MKQILLSAVISIAVSLAIVNFRYIDDIVGALVRKLRGKNKRSNDGRSNANNNRYD